MHLLRYLWPLPWTVVGLSLAVLVVAMGGRWRWHRGALECSGGRLGRWAERGPSFVPAYLLASVWALRCGGHVHADNAFERHAPPP